MKNFTQTIRKIFALGTGATLMGTTLLGASAVTDLGNYPSPYLQDGSLNAILVVGDDADAADVIGATDIVSGLQFESRVPVGVSSGVSVGSSVTGDAWKVGRSNDNLEIGESFADVFGGTSGSASIGKDDEELVVLDDVELRIGGDDVEYSQEITFNDDLEIDFGKDSDNDEVGLYLNIGNDETIANYTMTFRSGGATFDAEDFEDETLIILGQEYTVASISLKGAVNSQTVDEIELLSGAVQATLSEEATAEYEVDGTTYSVTLVTVTDEDNSDDEAIFEVNGETLKALSPGQTDTLDDGTEIGLRDASFNPKGPSRATFYLGADSVTLKDGQDVEFSDERKSTSTTVTIDSTADGLDDITLKSINIEIKADDNLYIGAGETLTESFKNSRNARAFFNAWDIEFAGLTSASTEDIRLTADEDSATLSFVDADGSTVDLPLLYTDEVGNDVYFGESETGDQLLVDEDEGAEDGDFFVVTEDVESYAIRLDSVDEDDGEVTYSFSSLGSGDEFEEVIATNVNTAVSVDFDVPFTVKRKGGSGANANQLEIDLNDDGDYGDEVFPSIVTDAGAKIVVVETTADELVTVTIGTNDEADSLDDTDATDVFFTIDRTGTSTDDNELDIKRPSSGNLYLDRADSDDNLEGYNEYGMYVSFDTEDSGDVRIDYPSVQLLPEVFVTTPGATIVEGADVADADDGAAYRVNRLAPGATRLASSVADIGAQNSIIVGGPCVNPAAASVLGVAGTFPACAAGFSEGQGSLRAIQQTGDNVALVVAGFSATDTRRAARVLADYDEYSLSGDNIVVRGSNAQFTDIMVSEGVAAPEAAAEEPAADADAEASDSAEEGTDADADTAEQ